MILQKPVHLVRLLLLCAFLFSVSQSHAGRVGDLYSASAPLQGDAPEQRDKAIQRAFSKVLLKVSGSTQASKNQALLGKAASLFQQYQSRNVEAAEADQKPQQVLWVQFDASAIFGEAFGVELHTEFFGWGDPGMGAFKKRFRSRAQHLEMGVFFECFAQHRGHFLVCIRKSGAFGRLIFDGVDQSSPESLASFGFLFGSRFLRLVIVLRDCREGGEQVQNEYEP